MNLLTVKNISLSYGGLRVINNLSFNVKQGEIVSIIGPNAAGKSTVLKSIAGLLKTDSGCIKIEEKDISKLTAKELSKKVSILLQNNMIPQELTVKELVYFGRYPHKKYLESFNAEDARIAEEVIRLTNLEKLSEKKLSELSGGEKQRAWIALSLAQKTDLLLLDEPTTYLDLGHQLEFLKLVNELNLKLGVTVIMVLHDLNQAAQYSSRIMVLKKGELFASGMPVEILTKENIKNIYGIDAEILMRRTEIHKSGIPIVLP